MLRHYLEEGMPKTSIARRLGISRMTVYRHGKAGKREHRYGPRSKKPSLLEAYKEYIRGRLAMYPELTASRVLAEISGMGYTGKYTLVKEYVKLIRPKVAVEIEEGFHAAPGQQAQVDFATFKTPFGTVYALLAVLSWSRYLWVRFFLHQDQLTVLGGLSRAFRDFGGVPSTVLFDRMKTAVAGSGEGGRAVFNEEMLRFALHFGFRPLACRPYRAKTKGRVERAVLYLRKSFFYVRYFRDLEDINGQVEIWLKETANVRTHGTTGEMPSSRLAEEKSRLRPFPDEAYVPVITLGRRVSRYGYVSYNGNDYSIPQERPPREVTVEASLEEVRFYHKGELIATHPLLEGKGRRRLDPTHLRGKRNSAENGETDLSGLAHTIEVQDRPLEVYEEVLR